MPDLKVLLFGEGFQRVNMSLVLSMLLLRGSSNCFLFLFVSAFFFFSLLVCLGRCRFVGQSRFPYHPDQLFDRSHVSNIANIYVPLITRQGEG